MLTFQRRARPVSVKAGSIGMEAPFVVRTRHYGDECDGSPGPAAASDATGEWARISGLGARPCVVCLCPRSQETLGINLSLIHISEPTRPY